MLLLFKCCPFIEGYSKSSLYFMFPLSSSSSKLLNVLFAVFTIADSWGTFTIITLGIKITITSLFTRKLWCYNN